MVCWSFSWAGFPDVTGETVLLQEIPEASVMEWGWTPGDERWCEVEYRPSPDGEVLFFEPAEKVWWLGEHALLILGSSGLALPSDVVRRKQVFVTVTWAGLTIEAMPVAALKDGIRLGHGAGSIREALAKRVSGVDASYISQVANYLAANTATLEVRGESLSIDHDGSVGGNLSVGGEVNTFELSTGTFHMSNGCGVGKVLTSDANGDASWQAAGAGFSLPVDETYDGSGLAFKIGMTGDARGGLFEISNALNGQNALEATTVGTGFALHVSHSGPSQSAAKVLSTGAGNIYPALKVTHEGAGPSLEASKDSADGIVALFVAGWASNNSTAVIADHYGNGDTMHILQNGSYGRGLYVDMDQDTNTQPGVEVRYFGQESALKVMSYRDASAAYFETSQATSPHATVDVLSRGSAPALQAGNAANASAARFYSAFTGPQDPTVTIDCSMGMGASLDVSNTGSGSVAVFESDDVQGANGAGISSTVRHGYGSAVEGVHEGEGSAGYFWTDETISVNPVVAIDAKSGIRPALRVDQNGTQGNVVQIYSNSSNPSTALVCSAAGNGNAAEFNGNVTVTGDLSVTGALSKGSGTFKIDHPLDPENQYLYHSFVESDEYTNLYHGTVELDAQGQARVTMPDWFEALNRSFHYQLTPIGAPGPSLYVAEPMHGNQFKIAGGEPFAEVSWLVTAVRQDVYAEDHPLQVEAEKEIENRGRYLYPQGFGADAGQQIGYRDTRDGE